MSQHFHQLKIADIKNETADTVSINFEVPASIQDLFKFKAGQYLTLRTKINGEDVRRSYSICSAPGNGELRVAVKAIQNGKFSNFAKNDLKAGDSIDVMEPTGNFLVKRVEGETNNQVFFAAGSGITPVISMIKSILNAENDDQVFLYYGNKTQNDIIFKSQLDALNNAHDNFNLTYVLSKEDSGNADNNGRIDENKCANFYQKDLADLSISGVYLCGPEEMINTVKDFYTSKGLLHRVHFELFTTPVTAAQEAAPIAEGEVIQSNVTVIIDDEEFSFDLSSDGTNILQAAQDADADVPFSCKGGVCCTCRAKVIEGSAKMTVNYALEEDEVADGFILTCQAHPTSEKVVVSYDEY